MYDNILQIPQRFSIQPMYSPKIYPLLVLYKNADIQSISGPKNNQAAFKDLLNKYLNSVDNICDKINC